MVAAPKEIPLSRCGPLEEKVGHPWPRSMCFIFLSTSELNYLLKFSLYLPKGASHIMRFYLSSLPKKLDFGKFWGAPPLTASLNRSSDFFEKAKSVSWSELSFGNII